MEHENKAEFPGKTAQGSFFCFILLFVLLEAQKKMWLRITITANDETSGLNQTLDKEIRDVTSQHHVEQHVQLH